MQRKTIILSSLGAGLEYYDFVIYLLLSTYFMQDLIPGPHAHTIAFAIYAVGFFIRPIGGSIIGWCADKWGRKASFFFIMWLMALSTVGIALIPSAAHIGVFAGVLLLLFRLCQGITFGGELPTAIVFIAEHVEPKQRGFLCSIMVTNLGIGFALATGICSLLTQHLSHAQMIAYGWRISFGVGAVVALLAAYLRSKINETPLFLAQSPARPPLLASLRQHKGYMLVAMGLILLPATIVTLESLWPMILHARYNYAMPHVFKVIFLGSLLTAVLIPVFGYVGDKIKRPVLYLAGVVVFMLGFPLGLWWLNSGSAAALYSFIFFIHIIEAILPGAYFVLLAELFPTPVRVTFYALAYNAVYALMACLPLVIGFLVAHKLPHWDLLVLLGGAAVLSIAAVLPVFRRKLWL